MALPDKSKIVFGTPLVFADATDYANVSAANDFGTQTHQLLLENLLNGAARQSAKADWSDGSGNLDLEYVCGAALEFQAAPTGGETLDIYIGWSNSATAANLNPGNLTGSDAAYTGSAGDSLVDTLPQLDYVGSMVLTADATTTIQKDTAIGVVRPKARYGSVVAYLNTATADLLTANADEMAIAFTPVGYQIQD